MWLLFEHHHFVRSSGPLGALLSSPALDVRLMTALQVLQGSNMTPTPFFVYPFYFLFIYPIRSDCGD